MHGAHYLAHAAYFEYGDELVPPPPPTHTHGDDLTASNWVRGDAFVANFCAQPSLETMRYVFDPPPLPHLT